jgi:hypothetical protein
MLRRSQLIALVAGLSLLHAAGVRAAESFTVADPQTGLAAIALAPDASEAVRANAEELADTLRQMCGSRPEVVTQAPDGPAIIVGTLAQFPSAPRGGELDGKGPEAFLLHSTAKRLYVVGNGDLAVQAGIFTLLREMGCRWFFPHEAWTVIPKVRRLRVEISRVESPDYFYRRIWYGWGPRTSKLAADYEAWQRHNRQLGWFQIHCGHAYESIVPHSLAEEHPEYFAEVDGKRPGNQLCTTNPDVIHMGKQYVLKAFEDNPNLNMISVEPNDGLGYCRCEQCRAVGTISDCVFLFANQMAEALQERFPGKYVGLYAYSDHTEPPAFDLHPNVYVQLTNGFRHTKMTFDEEIAAWSKRAKAFGIYDYFSVFPWDWDIPGKARASNLDYLRRQIPLWHRYGATTFDAESSCNWGPNGLGYYLAAQLMWDVDADADAIIADFYSRAFGEAAAPVRRYYERWQQGNELSERTLTLSYRDLDAARRATSNSGIQGRLDHLQMYLHWLRLKREFELAKEPEAIRARGRELIVFSRRLMDTGLIHAYPMLFSEWFNYPFKKLQDLEGVTAEMIEGWKNERTDIPGHTEVQQLFDEGVKAYGELPAAEVPATKWSHDLVPVGIEASDALLALLGERKESPFSCEKAVYYFPAEAGESFRLPFIPYPDHTLDVHWTLTEVATGQLVDEGDIKKQQNESAEIRFRTPRKGLYALNPGTDYWKAGRLEFARRPLVAEASRESEFMPWYPRADEPIYFFVPKGTKQFVLRLHGAGTSESDIRIYGPDGQVVSDNPKLPSGWDISVFVPEGADGSIWAFTTASLRSTLQLLGVPPFVARRPDELMTPREALGK